jgi:hypothetical protein
MNALLLTLHIAAGGVARVAAGVAIATAKGGRWHVRSGRIFALGMLVIFLTAVPMTIIRPNLFLFLVAVFSFYLVLTGWLRATNRSGVPTVADWVAATIMAVASVAMSVWAVALLRGTSPLGIVLLVFAGVGWGAVPAVDLYFLHGRRYRGIDRIIAHLARMLGGATAALTAFTVVNAHAEPRVHSLARADGAPDTAHLLLGRPGAAIGAARDALSAHPAGRLIAP